MTIRYRKYIVEFVLRTENDNPDDFFDNLLDSITYTSKQSPEKLQVVSTRKK